MERARRRLEREAPEQLSVKMWAFPYLTWVALIGILGVLAMMLLDESNRIQLYFTGGLAVVLAVAGWIKQKRAVTA